MSAQILDGKKLAQSLKEQLKNEMLLLKEKYQQVPSLVGIIVGEDPSACSYTNSQKKIAHEIGIEYELKLLPLNISQQDLIAFIEKLNQDKNVHGIMLHKPLPKQLDYHCVSNYILPLKDVEGMNISNLGKMMLNEMQLVPCTPAAVMEHIKAIPIPLRGKEVVIVGRSEIVGKPLALLMLKESATVTICHTGTQDAGKLVDHVKRADIVVAAVGKAGFVKGEWLKPGAVVMDVGINQVENKIVGDVDFESAKEKASFITPVPGGVGPVTVVMLMKNAIESFKAQIIS